VAVVAAKSAQIKSQRAKYFEMEKWEYILFQGGGFPGFGVETARTLLK